MTWLTIYLVALLAIPSRLIIGPLGGAGSPSQLLGLASLVWWAWYHLSRSRTTGIGRQPVRLALGAFILSVAVSYVLAMLRPIERDEISSADLTLLAVLAWAGTLLIANDGILTMDRLQTLLGRLAMAVGLLSVLGIIQFASDRSFVDMISVPGLVAHQSVGETFDRGQFTRPAGTSVHPIEYGMVLTMFLPVALHRGFYGFHLPAVARWSPLAAVALVIPLTLSRSAILGTVLSLAILVPTWPRTRRRISLIAVSALAVIMFVAVPGLIGTLSGMFTGIGEDSSAASRTGSYAIAGEFFARAPLLGRGLGTFLPRYRILDNQLLLLVIEIGILGLLTFLAMIITAVWCMIRLRRRVRDERVRDLAQSMVASLAAGLASLALFDGFSFPMATGALFLMIGLTGALWRLGTVGQDLPPGPESHAVTGLA
ncbi:O-antigen ligase family protein [Georgenia yuyongxinii]